MTEIKSSRVRIGHLEVITIEDFQMKLRETSDALIQLSKEFERLETDYSNLLCEDYPFSVCLLEVVHGMLEWQETINNHLEALKHGEETANS